MTSKEALEDLIEKAIHNCDDWDIDRLYTIEKDLETLDVIKKSIFNKEIHKYVLNEEVKGQEFMTIGLTIKGDDINKIKEWLENGQRKNDRNLQ